MQGTQEPLQRNSPFAIKPRLDPALWSWLLHFAARCNERDMIEAGRGIQALLISSLPLYRELIETEAPRLRIRDRAGCSSPTGRKHEMDAYAATDRLDERDIRTARPGAATAS